MNTAELAATVLGFKSHVPNLPTVREMLGENYGQALGLGWLVPDFETGMIAVTNDHSRLAAMETAAKDAKKTEIPTVTNESWRDYSPFAPKATLIIEDDALIGDQVAVAVDGKVFNGVVQSIASDGSYVLSFGESEKPSRNSFKTEELRVTQRADKPSATPANNATATPSVAAAPSGRLPVPGVG